jgi:hypothetical protein
MNDLPFLKSNTQKSAASYPKDDVKESGPGKFPLNPNFLNEKSILVLGETLNCLTIGSVNDFDHHAVSALEFASGKSIEWTVISEAEFNARVAAPGREQAGISPVSVLPIPETRLGSARRAQTVSSTSLLDRVMAGFDPVLTSVNWTKPLAQLLAAGYSPQEAGEALLGLSKAESQDDHELRQIAGKLRDGQSINCVIKELSNMPEYLPAALNACNSEQEQIAAFIAISACTDVIRRRRSKINAGISELAMMWLPVTIVWFTVAGWAGSLAAIAGVSVIIKLRELAGRNRMSDLLRAEVMHLICVLSTQKMPPSVVIRAATSHLSACLPTWGSLPDTRERLALALAMTDLPFALLLKGELADAARRLAAEYSDQSETALSQFVHLSRIAAASLFSIALVLLLAS